MKIVSFRFGNWVMFSRHNSMKEAIRYVKKNFNVTPNEVSKRQAVFLMANWPDGEQFFIGC